MNSITWNFAIVAATFLGPILAVLATRWIDSYREKGRRRYDIFVALMTTRRITLSPEHISAINRIEIEFSDNTRVIDALQKYMDVLSEHIPKNEDAFKSWERKKNRSFAVLVQKIGAAIGRDVDRNDLIDGGYYPKGLADREEINFEVAKGFRDLLNQERPLLVAKASFQPTTRGTEPSSKYPDPPA